MARRVIGFAVAAYLLLVFADRFVLFELLVQRIGVPFLLACCVALACIGTGFLARRMQRGTAMNLAIGYPIFGTLCFLVGTVRISHWTMVPLVGILGGVGLLSLTRPKSMRLNFAVMIVVVCGFIAAQAPPVTLDELAYHLAIPWTWVKEARAIDLPLISHSYFPLGVESADLPFLSILGTGGGIASHFLHLFVAIAAIALLFSGDALVVAAVVTAPVLAVTAGWSLVDWNLVAIALALMRAIDDDDRASIAAAVAAGLLTKYTFVPFVAIALWKSARPALIGAVGGSVFYIRNLILTGNPIAPFFTALAPHVAHYRSGAYLSDYVFDGRFIDESLGASLIGGAVATAGLAFWVIFAIGVLLFFLAPSARILVPFFAVPASRAQLNWRPLRVVLFIAVILQVFLVVYFVDRTGAFSLLSGRYDDNQFVQNARPIARTISAIDAAVPANSRTLVVGLNETFWFEHQVRGGGNFDGPRVSAYLEAATPEALRERLRRDGITHIAVISTSSMTVVQKKLEERETALSPAAQRSLSEMLNQYAANVSQRGDAALFALKP